MAAEPTVPDRRRAVLIETRAAWREWLSQHADDTQGAWLVTWKPATGRPLITYEESVLEAVCFGWIDSTNGTLDGERGMMWFSPRRPGSGWSRSNKERIERLERDGLMAEPGRRAIERAKADGSWTMLDSVEALIVPDELARAFAERPGATEYWEAFPRTVKRAILVWIVQAKRAETRVRRITEVADKTARGERAR